MTIFTEYYPGPCRITITGKPSGDRAVLKVFGEQSYRDGPTARAKRAGISGGCYPYRKTVVERGDRNNEDFRFAVRSTCVELSALWKTPVWDEGWGFAADEAIPFNDELTF